jgi:diguanylate cyclase (GGDEF)-like protein
LIDRRASETGQHQESSTDRVIAAEQRARDTAKGDEIAGRRDEAAAERDRAAERRERDVAELAAQDGAVGDLAVEELKRLLAEAASDRVQAAQDRRFAAEDRARAANARAEALAALEEAHFDDLTGAYRRGFGEQMIRAEIERARRGDGRLALVVVDVDGLKTVNDTEGHVAGDAMLRDVADAIQANVRSYEPVVRIGGDEFAFTLAGVDQAGAGERCAVIRAELARRPSGARISVGCAEFRPEDDFSDLYWRADAALVAASKRRGRFTRQP